MTRPRGTQVARRVYASWANGVVIFVISALACGAGSINVAQDSLPTTSQMRVYNTDRGGYTVKIPSSWLVSEFPTEGQYKASLSREPMQEDQNFKYGVAIWRTHNYRKLIQLSAHRAQKAATEFAQRIAWHEADGGPSEMTPVKGTDHGLESWEFKITTNGGAPTCVAMWLVIAIKGGDWFHAAWSVPCSERDSHADELATMVSSLAIRPDWKVSK